MLSNQVHDVLIIIDKCGKFCDQPNTKKHDPCHPTVIRRLKPHTKREYRNESVGSGRRLFAASRRN